jgi:hypothetical protein
MKANLVGKFVFDLEKIQIISFRGGTSNHEIVGNKPIVMAPNLKGVILENRQLVVSENTDRCSEENEGFILVTLLVAADPAIQSAIIKDPDVLSLKKKIEEGIGRFIKHIPSEGEIARMFALIMENVRGERIVSELMNAIKEAFPDLYDKAAGGMDPADLKVVWKDGPISEEDKKTLNERLRDIIILRQMGM